MLEEYEDHSTDSKKSNGTVEKTPAKHNHI